VKGLVEMHGGNVEVRSDGPGKGSVFTIRLPRSVIAQSPGAAVALEAAQPVHSVPRRILVVEDNPDAAESLRLLLAGLGHQVDVVNDGREAVDAARRLRPDVILLDIGLPGVDGFHIAKALRGLPETSAARLIAVSGYGQEKDRERSKEAGFDLHFVKPVDPRMLTAAIDSGD
jgi:two-component system CheB/CheR fusion protein